MRRSTLVLTTLVLAGLGLLGTSVSGMANLDDTLHTAVLRAQQEELRLKMIEHRRDCDRAAPSEEI